MRSRLFCVFIVFAATGEAANPLSDEARRVHRLVSGESNSARHSLICAQPATPAGLAVSRRKCGIPSASISVTPKRVLPYFHL